MYCFVYAMWEKVKDFLEYPISITPSSTLENKKCLVLEKEIHLKDRYSIKTL